jgi:dipeptidyl aminopeptidase/acylaminoacyl peptidase
LIHGDQDTLVPIEHSRKIVPHFEQAGVAVKLVTVEGAGHGFTPKQSQEVMTPALLDWFAKHLAAK